MDYAVIKSSGKQFKVKVGDVLELDRQDVKAGDKIVFEEVLLLVSDKNIKLGTPTIKGVKVKATVLEHTKGEKIYVSKFKSKVRYRRVTGHRQKLTEVKIDEIVKS